MAWSTRSRVAAFTMPGLLTTFEMVLMQTPAFRATSLIVALW